jgi:UDP-N-acetylglucosamine 1-carboxyvinyltransferase
MSQCFRVVGGTPLEGTVRPAGNKNAALPIIAASLLADGPSKLLNVPRIRDVEALLNLVADLGADVQWSDDHSVRIDPANIEPKRLDPELCAKIRASILLAGPLVGRFGRMVLPPPGGDVIGRRRLDTHFVALEQLGATVEIGTDYRVETKGLVGADIFLDASRPPRTLSWLRPWRKAARCCAMRRASRTCRTWPVRSWLWAHRLRASAPTL